MPTQTSKTDLQKYFVKGAFPTQEQFYDWMESYHHKEDEIPQANVKNLVADLNSKATLADKAAIENSILEINNHRKNYLSSAADSADYPTVAAVKNYVDAKTVNISSDFNHWRKHYIEDVVGRGTVLVLDATDPYTSDLIPVEGGDIIRFYVPWIEKDGAEVATLYQYNRVVIRLLDKQRNEVYYKWVSSSAAERKASALTVKDCYGVCIDIQLGRSSDGYLYPRTMGVVKQDAIVAQATVAPSGSIALDNDTYTVSLLTPDVFGVKALTDDCEIVLPVLDDNKAVTFIIDEHGKGLTIGGTFYEAGDTVFCSFDYDDTGAWSVNNTKEPEVVDYSDVSVDWALDSTFKSYSNTSWSVLNPVFQVQFPAGTLPTNVAQLLRKFVLVSETIEYVNSTANQTLKDKWRIQKGLYFVYDITQNSKLYIKKITDIKSLSLVTCNNENLFTHKGIWKVVKSDLPNGSYLVKIDDVYSKSETYNKLEVDNKLSSVYKYKGSLSSYSMLPVSGQVNGDVYNVVASAEGTNINYAWNGSAWDNLGGIEPLATATNNGLMSISDFSKLAAISGTNTGDETKASVESKLLASNLSTSSKEIVPAINELKTLIGSGSSAATSAVLMDHLALGLTGSLPTLTSTLIPNILSKSSVSSFSLSGSAITVSEDCTCLLFASVNINKSVDAMSSNALYLFDEQNNTIVSEIFPPMSEHINYYNGYGEFVRVVNLQKNKTYHLDHNLATSSGGTATYGSGAHFTFIRLSGQTSVYSRSEYLTAYLTASAFTASSSYSKMNLIQKTYESGLNMKSANTSIVGNRIQTSQAGKYRVDLSFSLYGGSGDVNLVLAIRKYNTTKYSASGNYRVEKELAGFTKDTNLIGCTISCSFELEMDANDVGATPTGIEVALKATANPSTINIPANACHISIEKIG